VVGFTNDVLACIYLFVLVTNKLLICYANFSDVLGIEYVCISISSSNCCIDLIEILVVNFVVTNVWYLLVVGFGLISDSRNCSFLDVVLGIVFDIAFGFSLIAFGFWFLLGILRSYHCLGSNFGGMVLNFSMLLVFFRTLCLILGKFGFDLTWACVVLPMACFAGLLCFAF
jgi:hypothetical protein